MARFRGTVQGGRGQAARLGHSSSGLETTANGWDQGVQVSAHADMGADIHRVFATSGSGGRRPARMIAEISDASGKPMVTLYNGSGRQVARFAV